MDLSCFDFDKKLGYVANLEFSQWPPEKVLEILSHIGYKAVSWRPQAFDIAQKGQHGLRDLERLTRQFGMVVTEANLQLDMITPDPAVRRERIGYLQKYVLAAGEAGGVAIKTNTGPAPWNPQALRIPADISEGQAWESVSSILQEVLPLAEQSGVPFLIEPTFGHLCHDYYTFSELLRLVPSPNLGVVVDPSHFYLYDNDIPWAIRRLGDSVKHVHVKDIVGKLGPFPSSFVFPLLGEGQIEWTPLLQALKDINYRGFFTIEFESFTYYRRVLRSDPVRAAQQSFDDFRQLIKYIEEDSEFGGASPKTPWLKPGA